MGPVNSWEAICACKTRRRMARERRGASSSVVSIKTIYYKTIFLQMYYRQTRRVVSRHDHVLQDNSLHRILHIICQIAVTQKKLLHTNDFTHRRFHTQKLLHTKTFYTQTLLHTEAFTHTSFYTQTLLHTDTFTHRSFLHTDTFTHRRFYTQKLLHTEAFMHRSFYTQTLLHTDAFTQRSFYTQKLLHTDTH